MEVAKDFIVDTLKISSTLKCVFLKFVFQPQSEAYTFMAESLNLSNASSTLTLAILMPMPFSAVNLSKAVVVG